MSGTSSTFTTLPDGSILSETLAGSSYYYLSDGMGNVAALTDGSGTIVDQYAYDPMGNITSSSGSVANPFTFQGWMYDSQNNLYYTGSSYYDPATGQSFGCDDTGPPSANPATDASEDSCGEDEHPECGGVCRPSSRSYWLPYRSTTKGNVRGEIKVTRVYTEVGIQVGYELMVKGLANGWKRGRIAISLKLVYDNGNSKEILLNDKRTCFLSTQCSYPDTYFVYAKGDFAGSWELIVKGCGPGGCTEKNYFYSTNTS